MPDVHDYCTHSDFVYLAYSSELMRNRKATTTSKTGTTIRENVHVVNDPQCRINARAKSSSRRRKERREEKRSNKQQMRMFCYRFD